MEIQGLQRINLRQLVDAPISSLRMCKNAVYVKYLKIYIRWICTNICTEIQIMYLINFIVKCLDSY